VRRGPQSRFSSLNTFLFFLVSRRVGNRILTRPERLVRNVALATFIPSLDPRNNRGSAERLPPSRSRTAALLAFAVGASQAAVSYSAPCGQGSYPRPTPFFESGIPVHVRRISCSFSSSDEVLFSFPLRYFCAIDHHTFIFSLGWPAPPLFS
jgi:hypothetical protein